jgi:hypothetical protein
LVFPRTSAPGSSAPHRRSTLREWASAELSRRVEKVVGYQPLSELDEQQRRELAARLVWWLFAVGKMVAVGSTAVEIADGWRILEKAGAIPELKEPP